MINLFDILLSIDEIHTLLLRSGLEDELEVVPDVVNGTLQTSTETSFPKPIFSHPLLFPDENIHQSHRSVLFPLSAFHYQVRGNPEIKELDLGEAELSLILTVAEEKVALYEFMRSHGVLTTHQVPPYSLFEARLGPLLTSLTRDDEVTDPPSSGLISKSKFLLHPNPTSSIPSDVRYLTYDCNFSWP